MEILKPRLHPPLLTWLETVDAAQEHLGDLHDFQVSEQAFEAQDRPSWSPHPLPDLRAAPEDLAATALAGVVAPAVDVAGPTA